MSDEPLEEFERQIASMGMIGSPVELRGVVLREVGRELRAARWDRRLARVAVLLLVLGVGLNATLQLGPNEFSVKPRLAENRASFVETAVVLADATDPLTARLMARQMAAMAGRKLTDGEAAAIEAAMRRPRTLGNKG